MSANKLYLEAVGILGGMSKNMLLTLCGGSHHSCFKITIHHQETCETQVIKNEYRIIFLSVGWLYYQFYLLSCFTLKRRKKKMNYGR